MFIKDGKNVNVEIFFGGFYLVLKMFTHIGTTICLGVLCAAPHMGSMPVLNATSENRKLHLKRTDALMEIIHKIIVIIADKVDISQAHCGKDCSHSQSHHHYNYSPLQLAS